MGRSHHESGKGYLEGVLKDKEEPNRWATGWREFERGCVNRGTGMTGCCVPGWRGGGWQGGDGKRDSRHAGWALGRGCVGGVTAVLSYFTQSSPLIDLVYKVGYHVEVCLQNRSHS